MKRKKTASNTQVIKLNSQDSKQQPESTMTTRTEVAQVSQQDSLISIAISSGRSMEEIGKLIEYRNNEIARLAKLDFIASKKEFTKRRKRIIKSNEADYGVTNQNKQGAKYKFEDLDDIDIACKDAAAECDLTWDWKTTYEGDYIYVTCILSHISGHSESDTMRAKADGSGGKNAIQADASANTYLMRYTLKKVLGLAAGKDDDGKASGPPVEEKQTARDGVKIPVGEAKFNTLLKAVVAKEDTVENLMAIYRLSAEQVASLKAAAV